MGQDWTPNRDSWWARWPAVLGCLLVVGSVSVSSAAVAIGVLFLPADYRGGITVIGLLLIVAAGLCYRGYVEYRNRRAP